MKKTSYCQGNVKAITANIAQLFAVTSLIKKKVM